ncbi:hypothetical protein EXIGLDRAFT_727049 [Exidia glandulosa HHB12029]|uniref:Uncharacterized protein n=1 Tax=Exidia glandulosa HHB12029 TaxID=1314781 RepID=A0A165C3A0_EXIGL|nr:hypothetical protein EXIGLDRAFT_730744 [Exidia glandulosa HHB12029]KZV98713.1 hypothetical protein EXIGLDRAFT_727049 [Exidia glandulosa HHB12029]
MSVPHTPSAVQLHPNSLYILTSPLMHGAFHWSLVHTDAYGRGTRHHWAPSSTSSRSERYVEQDFRGPSDAGVVIALFRLTSYVPLDLQSLRLLCAAVFPSSFATAEQNRAHGLNCRTWIARLLGRLREAGHLQRTADALGQMETKIHARSATCELEYLNAFMFQRVYHPAVENV